jgi:hypothetical protein
MFRNHELLINNVRLSWGWKDGISNIILAKNIQNKIHKQKMKEISRYLNIRNWWCRTVMPNSCAAALWCPANIFWECIELHAVHGFGHGILSRCVVVQKRLTTSGVGQWFSNFRPRHTKVLNCCVRIRFSTHLKVLGPLVCRRA